MIEISLISILLLHFYIQVFPRINNSEIGIDLYRWLLYSDEIKKNGHKLPSYIDRYIIKERFSYPFLLLFILSFFPKLFLYKFNYIIAPIFSVIENIFLYLFIYFCSNDQNIALLGSLIYATTASNTIENTFLSTRSIGQLVVSLSYFGLYLYVFEAHSLLFFILACSLLMITHRMSVQIILFLSVFYSVYFYDFYIFTAFLVAFLLAVILTRGHYLLILKSHVMQIIAYIKHITANKEFIKVPYIELFTSILSRNIYIPIVAYLYLFYPPNDLSNFLFWSIFFIFLVSVITTYILVLRSIGEGYRYIGYTNVLSAIYIATNHNQEFMLIFSFTVISLLITFYKQYHDTIDKKNKSGISMFSKNINSELESIFLNSNKKIKFMSFPPVYDDYVAYHFPNSLVMFHDNGLAIEKSYGYMLLPYTGFDPKFFLDKYLIDVYVARDELNIDGFFKKEIDNVFIYKRSTLMKTS